MNPLVTYPTTRGPLPVHDLCERLPQRTVELIDGPAPEVGQRHGSLMEVAYRCGESGLSNHEILFLLNNLCDRWGKYPNWFDRWRRLLGIVRKIRSEFPNSPDGTGHRS